MLYVNLTRQDDILYAHLEGKLTRKETYKIEQYLIPYIKKNKIKCLCCDCLKLKKMDIDGKYALLNVKVQLKKQQGNFLLCNMSKQMKEGLIGFHFKILNLQKMEV